jgi:hypothetical protein
VSTLALMTVFLFALVILNAARDPIASMVLALVPVTGVILALVIWRRVHAVVSDRGLRVGLFARRWLAWSDIAGFSRDSLNPMSSAIFACTRRGERVLVCGVPFYPLMLDTRERHEHAVERLLAELEEARGFFSADRP